MSVVIISMFKYLLEKLSEGILRYLILVMRHNSNYQMLLRMHNKRICFRHYLVTTASNLASSIIRIILVSFMEPTNLLSSRACTVKHYVFLIYEQIDIFFVKRVLSIVSNV